MTKKKVLIIDDNKLICLNLEKKFTSMGFTALCANTGREALKKIRCNAFDLIFLDIHLPDANGLNLLGEIRESSPNTKVIVMSADINEEYREQATRLGASNVIDKPFSLLEVEDFVLFQE